MMSSAIETTQSQVRGKTQPISLPAVAITIVIPVYNTERYLEACLDSVFAQTHPDFEVVCVNDASNDNSAKILMQYLENHSNLTVVTHAENRGLGAARNSGLRSAQGRFVMFLDSDDLLDSELVARLRPFTYSLENNLVLTLPRVIEDATGKITSWMDKGLYMDLLDGKSTRSICSTHARVYELEVSSCRKLFRTETLRDFSLQFPEGKLFEDFGFHFESLWCARSVVLTDIHSFDYRVGRAGQITGTKSPRRMEIVDVLLQSFDRGYELGYPDAIRIRQVAWAANFFVWCLKMTPSENRDEFLRRAAELNAFLPLKLIKATYRARLQPRKTILAFYLGVRFPRLSALGLGTIFKLRATMKV